MSESRIAKHDSDRPYTCDTCDYTTKRKATLKDHLKTHQTHRLRYKCPEENCDRDFGRNADLNRHTKAVSLFNNLTMQDRPWLISNLLSTMAPMGPTDLTVERVGGLSHEVTH